ncbi:lipopolysaccharide biosynthesis protein [Euzebya rosea]|uniref:lipopolysaccharide biosynthesis protein n=1 Tax=Euzebya rosea TaxID=2052804 RepID=UPI001300BABD|nr:hypothetical protein [Euzebya rosea]
MAAVLVVSQGATALGSLGITFITAALLGPTGRGKYALLLQLIYGSAIVVAGGVERLAPSLVEARILGSEHGRARAFSAVGLILAGLSFAPSPEVALLREGVVVIGGALCFAGYSIARGLLIAERRTRDLLLQAFVGQVLGLAAISLFLRGRSDGVVGAVSLLSFSLAVSTLVIERTNRLEFLGHWRAWSYHAGLTMSGVALFATRRADRLLLPAFQNLATLGVYSVPATLGEMLGWPVQMLSEASMRPDGMAVQRFGMSRLVLALLGALLLIGPVVLYFVPLILGEQFAISWWLAFWLTVSGQAFAVSRLWVNRLISLGQTQAAASTDLISGMIGLIVYPILILGWSAEGAALASVLVYSSAALYAVRRLSRVVASEV